MFRIHGKRAPWIALGLVLGVLLLPVPATAGGFWEGAGAQSWEGMWAGLLDWLGLSAVEASLIYIDPDGQPGPMTPGLTVIQTDSSFIDPDGQPRPLFTPTDSAGSESSSLIDPNGKP